VQSSASLVELNYATNPDLEVEGGGGIKTGELATNPDLEVEGGGGIRTGELATNPDLEVEGGGGIKTGELATNPDLEVEGGGGIKTGELATARPVPIARSEVRTAKRSFNEFVLIVDLLPWVKLCTEMVP